MLLYYPVLYYTTTVLYYTRTVLSTLPPPGPLHYIHYLKETGRAGNDKNPRYPRHLAWYYDYYYFRLLFIFIFNLLKITIIYRLDCYRRKGTSTKPPTPSISPNSGVRSGALLHICISLTASKTPPFVKKEILPACDLESPALVRLLLPRHPAFRTISLRPIAQSCSN